MCGCRLAARSPPGTPPPPSRSRPASATCPRAAAVPLRALAALVAYSRVHTGVHYPGDVLAGALIGTTLAQLTTHAWHPAAARPDASSRWARPCLVPVGHAGPGISCHRDEAAAAPTRSHETDGTRTGIVIRARP